jgi:NADH:ubiquinone oxidoreductase 27 kD subunit
MSARLEKLSQDIRLALGEKLATLKTHVGEITIEVKAADLLEACLLLRDAPELKFEQLIDLCGVDYVEYGDGAWTGQRYAVVYHLLSVSLNQRVRLRVFAEDEDFPVPA